MRNRHVTIALAIAVSALFAGACTQTGPGTGHTTTTPAPPATVPVSGYFIKGSIAKFSCGLTGCNLAPAGMTVHVMTKANPNKVVNQTNSFDANGNFTISVPSPGTYTVHVVANGFTQCTTAQVALTPEIPIATVPDTIVCR